mmetsp:Transcript_61144/g.101278  ORF Transcript_61144/g.101278 Transcript_61144/m.101278 type:complete len:99 (-) Transcript_61144:147-443(-)
MQQCPDPYLNPVVKLLQFPPVAESMTAERVHLHDTLAAHHAIHGLKYNTVPQQCTAKLYATISSKAVIVAASPTLKHDMEPLGIAKPLTRLFQTTSRT